MWNVEQNFYLPKILRQLKMFPSQLVYCTHIFGTQFWELDVQLSTFIYYYYLLSFNHFGVDHVQA